jgi:hypothetical protein
MTAINYQNLNAYDLKQNAEKEKLYNLINVEAASTNVGIAFPSLVLLKHMLFP